jgi:hypothetical protein
VRSVASSTAAPSGSTAPTASPRSGSSSVLQARSAPPSSPGARETASPETRQKRHRPHPCSLR